MSTHVFQVLQKQMVDNVTLKALMPELNQEQLLTQHEEQLLTNEYKTEYERKMELTSILRTKGPGAPSAFIRCLRNEGSIGHVYLAGVIERHIGGGCGSGASCTHTDVFRAAGQVYGCGVPCSSTLVGQGQSCSRHVPHLIAGDMCQLIMTPSSSHMQSQSTSTAVSQVPISPCRQFMAEWQPGMASLHHPTAHSHSLSTCSSASLPFETAVEEQDGDPISARYDQMVGNISTFLRIPTRNIPFESVVSALHTSLQDSGIALAIPGEINDVAALLNYLRTQQMCHKYDVDLLCELLKRLEQHDLHQEVKAYAQSIMHCNVLQCGPSSTTPVYVPGHFVVFTIHNCPSLTYGQACEVKDVLSELLGIDRHTFWLTSSESGSVVLGWSFREEVAKHVCTTLEDSSTQKEMASRGQMHNVLRVEVLYQGSRKRITVFSAPSTSPLQPSGLQLHSTITPVASEWTEREGGEGREVSSTTMELDEPHLHLAMVPRIGSKRRHSADTMRPDSPDIVETDHVSRPTNTVKRLRTTTADHPSLKRKPVESSGTESPKLRDMKPKQYIPPSQKTGEESEAGCIRALKENQPYIVERMNLMSILPYLNAHLLLTGVENEQMQMKRVPESERIITFLTALEKKGEEGFHKFLAALEEATDQNTHREIAKKLKQTLQTMSLPVTSSPSPPPLMVTHDHLRDRYKSDYFFKRSAGPHIKDLQFIRLALVKKQGVSEEDRGRDKFLKATLHGHVEDIVKRKRKLKMDDIFRYGKKSRKVVLVEGAPGVGKTMLAMKLCEKWARGESLQEYDLVFFVELRKFQGKSKLKLHDVVGDYLEEEEMVRQVVQYLVTTRGEKFLMILEGWDELSPALRNEYSLFFELIKGDKLPNASIMVTSRPSVTAPLYDYMDERRVEVLGFDEEQQNEYIKKNVTDSSTAQRIRDHLKQFPNLRALAHIPLTLQIICHVAIQSDSLPATLTELYDKFTCHLLFHSLKKKLSTLIGLDSLEQLPEDARQVFLVLCKLALHGFRQKSFIFESHDLEELGLPCSTPGFDGFGLLSTLLQSATAGKKLVYQFRHLSIQEYLAGLEMDRLPLSERLQLLTKFRTDRQFQNIWKFLAGITKLQDKDFRGMIINPTRTNNRDHLFLLHCLYEAQNPEICQIAADKINCVLHLDNTTLNATDCLCMAYVMGSAMGTWQVNLRGCNIGGDGLEVIKWQLKEHDSPHLTISVLDVTHNQLDGSDMHHLTEMLLRLETKILRVEIESNKIGDEGVRELSRALKENTSLIQMQFRTCGLTSESARWFSEALKCNTTFKNVYFGFDNIGDDGTQFLAKSLYVNKTLEELGLASVGLTGIGLTYLADALKINRTLKILRIDRNNLGAAECHIITEILRTHDLDLMDISKNSIGDDGLSAILDAMVEKPNALKRLGAFGCEFTSREFHKFVELFKTTTVFKGMHIGLNHIGDRGVELIAQALEGNKSESVKEIYLETTGLSDRGKQLVLKVNELREDLCISFLNASVGKTVYNHHII